MAPRPTRSGKLLGMTTAEPERRSKPGWQVPTWDSDAVRRAVADGAADSQNAFVERALLRELRQLRRRRVYDDYTEAAADPVFQEDLRKITAAFEPSLDEGLR